MTLVLYAMWPIALQSCTWEKSSNCRIAMNSMPLPSIPTQKLYFQLYLSRTHKLRSAASASFFLAICPVQLIFQLVVASIRAAPWHSRSVAKLSQPTRQRKVGNITQHVISLNLSRQAISKEVTHGKYRSFTHNRCL